jgi:MoaA/NifB/PqqE/SkfB family radical SAM enzyme
MGFPAGSKGGLYDVGQPARISNTLQLVESYERYIREGQEDCVESILAQLRANYRASAILGIYANNLCNLQCLHCYYGFKKTRDPELSLDEWDRVIAEAYAEGFRRFAIVGKEPFINGRAVKIMRRLERLRKEDEGVIFGVVNNGMFLERWAEELYRLRPDYIDVSVDGLEQDHDALRGRGSFSKVLANLAAIDIHAACSKLFVSSVLHGRNCRTLQDLIPFFAARGISNFYINLIYNAHDEDLALGYDQMVEFLEYLLPRTIRSLAGPVSPHVMISFDLSLVPDPARFHEDYVRGRNLQVDANGVLFRDVQVGANARLSHIIKLPQAFYEPYLAVSSDGYAGNCINFHGESIFSHPDYWKLSSGNVRNSSIKMLVERNLEDIRRNLHALRWIYAENRDEIPGYSSPFFLGANQEWRNLGAAVQVGLG